MVLDFHSFAKCAFSYMRSAATSSYASHGSSLDEMHVEVCGGPFAKTARAIERSKGRPSISFSSTPTFSTHTAFGAQQFAALSAYSSLSAARAVSYHACVNGKSPPFLKPRSRGFHAHLSLIAEIEMWRSLSRAR